MNVRARFALLTGLLLPLAAPAQLPTGGQQQQKAVHFKKLEEFLPTRDLPGFKRSAPSGSTSSAMGMTTSEASIRYVKEGKDGQSVDVKIADLSVMPFGAMAMAATQMAQSDFENESESGYEKSVTVAGRRGTEEVHKGGRGNCKIGLIVGNRFAVDLSGSGFSDPALLRGLAESMNLAGLEKAQ